MAMAKFTVDTTNKLFIAKAGVTVVDLIVDLYSDAKEHWLTDPVAIGFDFPFGGSGALGEVVGGNDIDVSAGTKIPTYLFLRDGWRIRPDEADHTLQIENGILLVFGGGDPFVDTLGAFTVRVRYEQPVQAITTVSSGVSQATLDAIQATVDAMSPVLDATKVAADHVVAMTDGKYLVDPTTGKAYIYDAVDAVYREAPVYEDAAGLTPYGPDSTGIERRDRFVAP